jgi:HK97 family phage major capsid protein
MKELLEKRNAMLDELDKILDSAKGEKRAFNEEEIRKVAELKTEIGNIDQTLKLEEEVRGLEKKEVKAPKTEAEKRAEVITKEERSFIDFVKGVDTRALSAGSQGVVIPVSVANKIIDTVKNISPIVGLATHWEVNNDLILPSYDFTQHVPAGYYTELATMTAQSANFGSIKLGNIIVASLALVSKSLINRTDIDILPFIVGEVAKAIAYFLEGELLNNANSSVGSGAVKLGGLANVGAGMQIAGATTMVITVAELLNIQMKVPQVYQANCAWIMSTSTLAYIQGLTASTGILIMGNTLHESAPFTILGKPVYVSDHMPNMGVSAKEIFYGDFSGLHLKLTKNLELQVLNERFADQYAVGVVATMECDSAIIEPQKIAMYVGK